MTKEEIALHLTVATIGHPKLVEEPNSKIDPKLDIDNQLTERLGKHIANLYNTIIDNIDVK